MRVLAVVPSYLPGTRYGGPIRSVHGLSRALVARGHAVHVLTTDCDQGQRLTIREADRCIDGVTVEHCRWSGPERLRHSSDFHRALAGRLPECDVVWVNGLFELCSSRAMRAARRAGVPYVLSPRGMLDATMLERRGRLRKRLWIELLDRRSLFGAAALHLTAELEREQLPDLGQAWPECFVLPNGVEHEPFRGQLSSLDGRVRASLERPGTKLLFLGRLSWKKGVDRVLEALSLGDVSARLVVAGPDEGAEGALRARAAELGLNDRVDFVGEVAGPERSALLEGADALVLPSHSENFGNVVVEALAAGTPAIVTPEVGAAEVLRASGAGRVVEGRPEPWAEALRRLEQDPAELERLRARSLEAAAELSWARLAARAEAAFAHVLGRAALHAA